MRRRSVASSETFVIGKVRDFVAPFLGHVKTLRVPDVRLQPHASLPLSAVVLLQQVGRPPPVPPAWPLRLYIGRALSLRFLPADLND